MKYGALCFAVVPQYGNVTEFKTRVAAEFIQS